jgi:hypothetical protein
MQAGACWILGANSLIPGIAESWVDANGRLFGLVNVCGLENILVIEENSTGAGELFNVEDDLVTVCPFTVEVVPAASGGTGTGGGGV